MSIIYNPQKGISGAQRTAVSVLKEYGVTPSVLVDDLELLSSLLTATLEAFEQEIRLQNVAILYLFDEREQPKQSPLRGIDGIDLKHSRRGAVFHSIGIECGVIRRHDAQTYVPGLFLHELCHVHTGPDHNDEFEQRYNFLLSELEKRTGLHVENDYAGYTPDQHSKIND